MPRAIAAGLVAASILIQPALDARAATPRLIRDLETGRSQSYPVTVAGLDGGRALLAVGDGALGVEPWLADASGVTALGDLCAGACGSHPAAVVSLGGGRFLFQAFDAPGSSNLWLSDGSAAGTRIVAPLCAGAGCGSNGRAAAALGGSAVLTSPGPDGEWLLWRSDGTAAGTLPVATLHADAEVAATFAVVGSRAVIRAANLGLTGGGGLWTTDGTAAGTVRLLDGSALGGGGLVSLGTQALFSGVGSEGEEPWVTDGTAAGTHLLVDLMPGSFGSGPTSFVRDGSRAYFGALVPGDGPTLWQSDGSAAGTRRVANLCPGTCWRSHVRPQAMLGGLLLFQADYDLWSTDGSTASAIALSPAPPLRDPASEVMAGTAAAIFAGWETTPDNELWRTDGTPGGTARLADLNPSGYSRVRPLASLGADVLFVYDDGVDVRLGLSDGSAAGTRAIATLAPGSTDGSGPEFIAVAGERGLFLTNVTFDIRRVLWGTDGSAASCERVLDVFHSRPYDWAGAGGLQYVAVSASDISSESYLIATDGTVAGTRELLRRGELIQINPSSALGSALLFASRDAGTGTELWRADGYSLAPLADLAPGPASSSPAQLVTAGARVFFSADDGVAGRELWMSDGTALGTRMVVDLAPGPGSSQPTGLVRFGDDVLFTLGSAPSQLWRSGGTGATTRQLADLGPSTVETLIGSRPGGRAWLGVRTSAGDLELWTSDGSGAGTLRVRSLGATAGSWLRGTELPSGRAVFWFPTPAAGNELWTSDGTDAGTVPLADIDPGPQNGARTEPGGHAQFDDRLWFTGCRPSHGCELWSSDGTVAGTRLEADIVPGPDGSYPYGLVAGSTRLYFSAWDPVHGSEPWVVDLGAPLAVRFGPLSAARTGDLVRIAWTTLSEAGTLGFLVERAAEASGPWSVVGEGIEARGALASYQATDPAPDGATWYRVVELTEAGRGDVSEPVAVAEPDSPSRALGRRARVRRAAWR